jgi:transcriptional regulator with GAF, ATPase, and Fis domain
MVPLCRSKRGETTVIESSSQRSDEAFQKLLLRFSAAAARGSHTASLIRLFCQATREFFQVDGAYFWHCASSEELIGAEADGLMAERFRGTRLKASESAVAVEAIRQRKTIRVNHLDQSRYPMAAEFHAQAIMAAPLIVSNETIGAAVFLHCSDPGFFTEDSGRPVGEFAGSGAIDSGLARGTSQGANLGGGRPDPARNVGREGRYRSSG